MTDAFEENERRRYEVEKEPNVEDLSGTNRAAVMAVQREKVELGVLTDRCGNEEEGGREHGLPSLKG